MAAYMKPLILLGVFMAMTAYMKPLILLGVFIAMLTLNSFIVST
jgi:hypothetical protein